MAFFSPALLYPPTARHDRLISSDIAFGVWGSIILVALALISVASGVAPVADPVILPGS